MHTITLKFDRGCLLLFSSFLKIACKKLFIRNVDLKVTAVGPVYIAGFKFFFFFFCNIYS